MQQSAEVREVTTTQIGTISANKLEIFLSILSLVTVISIILAVFSLASSTKKSQVIIVRPSVSGNIEMKQDLAVEGDMEVFGNV